jgi:hypothetical protein
MNEHISATGSVATPRALPWRYGVVTLLLVAAFTAIFWSLVFWQVSSLPLRTEWRAELQLEFEGLDRGRYPVGRSFTTLDLISLPVLQRVVERLDLDLEPIELQRMLAVSIGTELSDELTEEFAAKLEQSTGEAEVIELQEQFLLQRSSVARSSLRLLLIEPSGRIPGAAVLEAIPREWVRYSLGEAGLFDAPLALHTAEVASGSVVETLDHLLAYDRLRELIDLVQSNIATLSTQPHASRVSAANGMRLADIGARAESIALFDLEEAVFRALSSGDARRPEDTMRILSDRIRSLRRQIAHDQERARRVDEVYRDYVKAGRGGVAGVGGEEASASGMLGRDLLNRLVSLGTEANEAAFRQEMGRRSLGLELSATQREAEVRRLQRLIDRIRASSDRTDRPSAVAPVETVGLDARDRFRRIQFEIADLVDATQQIAGETNRRRFGTAGDLYTMTEVFAPRAVTSWRSPILVRSWGAGTCAIALFGMLAGTLHHALRSMPTTRLAPKRAASQTIDSAPTHE